jgi:hypothetical protein
VLKKKEGPILARGRVLWLQQKEDELGLVAHSYAGFLGKQKGFPSDTRR